MFFKKVMKRFRFCKKKEKEKRISMKNKKKTLKTFPFISRADSHTNLCETDILRTIFDGAIKFNRGEVNKPM